MDANFIENKIQKNIYPNHLKNSKFPKIPKYLKIS